MSNVNLDAQKAVEAFKRYFEVWPDLAVVYLNLSYHDNFYIPSLTDPTQQRRQVDEHWSRLIGALDANSLVVGHLQKLVYINERFVLHCIFFLKYESGFFNEQDWIRSIGWDVWISDVTKGAGAYTFYPSTAQDFDSGLRDVMGLISKNNKTKRQKFVTWLNEFLSYSYPAVAPNHCFEQVVSVKELRGQTRRMEARLSTPWVPSKLLESLLSQQELDVLWDVKKQRMSVDAVRQISESKIIYKELLWTVQEIKDSPAILSMLGKIETFVYSVRYDKQIAFDSLFLSPNIPIQQRLTVLGRQLLDLYQAYINDLKVKKLYSPLVASQLSYSVKAFFTVWFQLMLAVGNKEHPVSYDQRQWKDLDYETIFNLFIRRLREYVHKVEYKRVVFHSFLYIKRFDWKFLPQTPPTLPSIHQRLIREDSSATKTLTDACSYVQTLFKRNVVLINIHFEMRLETDTVFSSAKDPKISNATKSAIFTEFLRYAANTAPLNHSLGYIGQWGLNLHGEIFPTVIFFMDAGQLDNIEDACLTLQRYWQKFLTEKVPTIQKLKLEDSSLKGFLVKSIIFKSLPEFNAEYCRINITDKKLQKLFISHVVLYLCKSRLYDHRYSNRPEKGLIKGTIKTAKKNIKPKAIRGRVRRKVTTAQQSWDINQQSNLSTNEAIRSFHDVIDALAQQENLPQQPEQE